ncbi:ribulose-bisphosphate carboxylase large subunit family protein (plasmid) [Ensifer adhaerens]|uniref:3-oxo-isoapionate-4-phosphate decarboxylase OiaX n=1 Tax=Ensifer adhaerens TaxID=106592 RepID=UPI0023A95029|nr:3-oxo-isoapionate-4-phosphate decarboxylase OiaX [Ensifer adhaerens]WDZ80281.1 ribulose-bisphosphate carboxylase large subunit family protein [Ensifer adhaerens]
MIRITYRIETAGSVEAMAAKIASDQSTGTFVALPGETEELKARVAARVVAVRHLPSSNRASFPDEAGGAALFNRADVDIDFPMAAVGTDLAALMTIAIGGVFSIKGMTGIRIVDMRLPEEFAAAHPGPQFGVPGSFALTGVKDRPIIGTIVKPALGLRPHETASMVGELIEAGVDFIKDDEKLMSPAYSSLKERVAEIMPRILDHEQRTGKKVMYAFGISHADPDEMMRNHDMVLEAGGNCAVVNINSVGFGGLAFLRKRSGLVLHAHRNGWDILTRHAGLGFEFSVWQQFWRLLGVDQFQINGIRVKYWEPDDSFVRSYQAVSAPLFSDKDVALPVIGSGQWGGQAPETFAATEGSTDLLYLCGGGIVSHPGGPGAGVKAVKQAWEAAVAGVPLETYAKDHRELAQSIEKFADGRAA